MSVKTDNSQNIATEMDELSYRNIVRFYAPELRMIVEGFSPNEVLGFRVRRKFRRLGVFKRHRGSNELSERTLMLLNSVA